MPPHESALFRRLGLGTVQFGLPYGITNSVGQVGESEAEAILRCASRLGIDALDTAHLYGGSEAALGRLSARLTGFQIVTKTPKFGECASAGKAVDLLLRAFAQSLDRLVRPCVYALLLHDADDLVGPHGAGLWAAMSHLRAQGLVRKIGVSVYEGAQIETALSLFNLDIVQLPINPLDRRLIEGGQLALLAERGVEVHARSLFLQGLLLAPPEATPAGLGPMRGAIAYLHQRFAAAGLTPLEGVFAWCKDLPIDRFICGVTSVAELEGIAFAAENAHSLARGVDVAGAPSINSVYLNPARWPALVAASTNAKKRT